MTEEEQNELLEIHARRFEAQRKINDEAKYEREEIRKRMKEMNDYFNMLYADAERMRDGTCIDIQHLRWDVEANTQRTEPLVYFCVIASAVNFLLWMWILEAK